MATICTSIESLEICQNRWNKGGAGRHGTLAVVVPDMCNVFDVGVKTLLHCRERVCVVSNPSLCM